MFVVSVATIVVVSLTGEEPLPEKLEYTWSPALFRAESEELAALPWYKNYRIQSAILLSITAVIVIMFW